MTHKYGMSVNFFAKIKKFIFLRSIFVVEMSSFILKKCFDGGFHVVFLSITG